MFFEWRGGGVKPRPHLSACMSKILKLRNFLKLEIMKNYVSRIKAVLKKNGKYNDGMTLLIDSTAISLNTMELCRKELGTLESTTVVVQTRYGKKLEPHPVFRTLRDAQTVLLKNCKELGLNYEELSRMVAEDEDTFKSFMKDVNNV